MLMATAPPVSFEAMWFPTSTRLPMQSTATNATSSAYSTSAAPRSLSVRDRIHASSVTTIPEVSAHQTRSTHRSPDLFLGFRFERGGQGGARRRKDLHRGRHHPSHRRPQPD